MKLSQVFEQLTSGELKQLKIGGREDGEIHEDNYRAMASHIILGLTALYTRFNLKEGELIVTLQDTRFTYPLQSKYAVNGVNSSEPVRYIQDTAGAKFQDDILKIESVIAVDTNVQMSLNDWNNTYSVMTPTMDTILVPAKVVLATPDLDPQLKTKTLKIKYRANHPNFLPRYAFLNPEVAEIELPVTHLQALLYFVASRIHNPIGMTNEFHAGNNYAAKFEMECVRLENAGLEIDIGSTNTRACRNGWV